MMKSLPAKRRAELHLAALVTATHSKCPALSWLVEAHGLTPNQLALDLGISRQFLSAVLRHDARERPGRELHERILAYLSAQLEIYKDRAFAGEETRPADILAEALYISGSRILDGERRALHATDERAR